MIHLEQSDPARPLPSSIVYALSSASQEMGEKGTFQRLWPFPRLSLLKAGDRRVRLSRSKRLPRRDLHCRRSKSDIGNLQEIFSNENKTAIPDPADPIYLEANILAGRTRLPLKNGRFGGITYLECTEENGFMPRPPGTHVDLIYLCSPSNPTGVAISREILKDWVDYARAHEAVIFFDGAYTAYTTSGAPRSIYEIEGAKEIAIEIRSFSKSAGSLRCSYSVIPQQLQIRDVGKTLPLHSLWKRRCETKHNGVSYPVQKAAAAIYSPKGKQEIGDLVRACTERTRFLRTGLQHLGYTVYGGIDAPYVWCKTPGKMSSWEFFDSLLQNGIVAAPGQGFGLAGNNFVRFSAFADQTAIAEALLRIKTL